MARLKRLVFFLIILLPAVVRCGEFEDRYGIGTVKVEPYNFFSLSFWTAPKDVMPFEQVYFFRDSLQDHLHFQFAMTGKDTAPWWFSPVIFQVKSEVKQISFYCLEREDDWCRVVVNNTTGQTKWLQLGVDVRFEEWTLFFSAMGSIDITEGDALLYESPKDKAKSSPLKKKADSGNSQLIRAKKVEGNWMQVEVTDRDQNNIITGKRTGWIKWRNESELLVGYNFVAD